MSIPLYKPYLPKNIWKFASETMNSGWLGYGPQANKLEKFFSQKFGGWALAVNSCTSALYIAARCAKETEDDEAIIPAITFVSTGMAFRMAGYKVIPVDVTPQGLISIESVKEAITDHTRVIVAVHLYGQRAQLESLRKICDAKKIILIEDCAHRVGLADDSRIGDMCCFSFNVMKELPSGEGGLLWCKDQEYESKAREFANVGLSENTVQRTATIKHSNYLFGTQSGLKFLQNDIIASLTIQLLELYEENLLCRKEIFSFYEKILSKYKEFTVLSRNDDDSRLMFVVRLEDKYVDSFRTYLAEQGIATSHHYPSLSKHPLFESRVDCTKALQMEREIISLPCFIQITKKQLTFIEEVIRNYAEINEFHTN